MITASELAGFCVAHAVVGLAESGILIPFLAYTTEDDKRKMERFAGEDVSGLIAAARQRLNSNEMDANDAVLLYNGQLSSDTEKTLAVIVEMRAYFEPDFEAVLGVPYTPRESGKFVIHQPQFVVWKGFDDLDRKDAQNAFFAGLVKNQRGMQVWRAHYAQ